MAKKFRFSLEALLMVRRLREREARRGVANCRAEIARVEAHMRRVAADIDGGLLRLREMSLAEEFDPLAASRCRAWLAQQRGANAQLGSRRAALLGELEKLQAVWRDARRQERVIEKLRENRWNEYVRDRAAEDQRESDDLAQQLQALCRIEGDVSSPSGIEDMAQL
ncbi:MAG: hypothetical protein JNG88_12535 [Phycisphaerales bacterium]|nr:hypothetical protein [Phycisphaerales bacterium]